MIPASGWARENLIQTLDRPWLAPSPALVEISQVGFYAIWGTLENFNLAVGRGKTNEDAFKVLGAPWITVSESEILAQKLNELSFQGAVFVPYSWKVSRSLFEGKVANGVRLEWSGEEIRSDEFTFKVSSVLVLLFKDRLNLNQMSAQSYGSQSMIEAIQKNKSWESLRPSSKDDCRICFTDNSLIITQKPSDHVCGPGGKRH